MSKGATELTVHVSSDDIVSWKLGDETGETTPDVFFYVRDHGGAVVAQVHVTYDDRWIVNVTAYGGAIDGPWEDA